jgi:ferredoxin-NADP reductase
MQTLILANLVLLGDAWSAVAGNPGLLAGWALLGIMALYGLTLFWGAFRRVCFERSQQALARERLRQEIQAAKRRCQEADPVKLIWNGWRKFEVARKVIECEGVASFYLAPHDKRPLPPFKPGQYITFQNNIPGQGKPVIRCYSLSDSPRTDYYRVTIKKTLPPPGAGDGKPGLVSSYFYDTVREGDILDVKAPGGHFFLDLAEPRPAVLISGGVGITPMMSMLRAIIDSGAKTEVWLFFGVRGGADHIFKEDLQQAAAQHENLRLYVCYSRPEKTDVMGRDYHHDGRVSVDLLKQLLPSNNYDYFLCGPGPLMNSMTAGLAAWGVPENDIHYEAFGPATVQTTAPPPAAAGTAPPSKFKVTFSRQGRTFDWNPAASSLLSFAEANGVKMEAGCRAGNCGTCLVAIKSGSVDYLAPAGASAEQGSCLACICKPKTDLVVDA